jgi:hypothetical protein
LQHNFRRASGRYTDLPRTPPKLPYIPQPELAFGRPMQA